MSYLVPLQDVRSDNPQITICDICAFRLPPRRDDPPEWFDWKGRHFHHYCAAAIAKKSQNIKDGKELQSIDVLR